MAGATNRGIGNEGLYLEPGKEYEGYFFAKAFVPVTVSVMLRNYETNTTLAQQQVKVVGGGGSGEGDWTRYDFSFTTQGGTDCAGIVPGSDPEVDCHVMRKGLAVPPNEHQGHACIKCAGEFLIGLSSPGDVYVDYVFLQPGAWGRAGKGPYLKSGVDTLKQMGITTIRLGGSFTDPSYYFWVSCHDTHADAVLTLSVAEILDGSPI